MRLPFSPLKSPALPTDHRAGRALCQGVALLGLLCPVGSEALALDTLLHMPLAQLMQVRVRPAGCIGEPLCRTADRGQHAFVR